MAKARVHTPKQPLRPLGLDVERAKRVDRRPYAIVDIGSNSVRLMVYDQLGRAPMPRFNEKSLARLAEGLAESGDFAPSPKPWASAESTRLRRRPCVVLRTG